MPGMTGMQLAGTIRQQWPEISVVLATGYAELPSDVSLDITRLNKPFRQVDLAQAIADSTGGLARKVVPFRSKRMGDHTNENV
jgi:CheY-like chemotaxis protein